MRIAVFTVVPVASLVAFVASFLAGAYNPNTTTGTLTALIGLGALAVWAFWFIWAGVALPASLRIAYLPLVVAFFLGGFGQHETLAFMGLGAVLSVGAPISLWRFTRQSVAPSQPADPVATPSPVGAE